MQKQHYLQVLKFIISLFLLGLLFWLARGNFSKIAQLFKSANLGFFSLALAAMFVGTVFAACRLKLILSAHNNIFNLKDLFNLTLIGHFFNNFMPTSLGGDLVKAHYISQKNNQRVVAYTSALIDRVIGLFSVTIIASLALLIMRKQIEHAFIVWAVAILLLGCILFSVIIFRKDFLRTIARHSQASRLMQQLKIDSLIKKIYQVVAVYAERGRIIAIPVIISVLAQGFIFISVYFLSKSLLVELSFARVLLVMPVIFVLCMLPISVNGLGVREWGFMLFFSPSIGRPAALSLSLLYLGEFLVLSLIGGIVYLLRR